MVVIAIMHYAHPGGNVVSELIILCLPFGIPIVAHFHNLWKSRYMVQKTKELVPGPRMFVLD